MAKEDCMAVSEEGMIFLLRQCCLRAACVVGPVLRITQMSPSISYAALYNMGAM